MTVEKNCRITLSSEGWVGLTDVVVNIPSIMVVVIGGLKSAVPPQSNEKVTSEKEE